MTLWTVTHQAPLSMEFSRQEYWSGLPCPPAGDLPDPGIEPMNPALANGFFTSEPHGKPLRLSFVQLLSRVQLFATPWTAAHQASLSFTISKSLLKLMSSELMMPSNHLILCHNLLFLPSMFPGSGSFPVSLLFASGGQSIETMAGRPGRNSHLQLIFSCGLKKKKKSLNSKSDLLMSCGNL